MKKQIILIFILTFLKIHSQIKFSHKSINKVILSLKSYCKVNRISIIDIINKSNLNESNMAGVYFVNRGIHFSYSILIKDNNNYIYYEHKPNIDSLFKEILKIKELNHKKYFDLLYIYYKEMAYSISYKEPIILYKYEKGSVVRKNNYLKRLLILNKQCEPFK